MEPRLHVTSPFTICIVPRNRQSWL